MLNYEEFRKEMIKELKNSYPEYSFREKKVEKLNEEYYGVEIQSKGENVSMIVNLEGYYEMYQSQKTSVSKLRWELWNTYRKGSRDLESVNEISMFINDFEKIKRRIYLKVVSRDYINKSALQDTPHQEFLNLIAHYYIDFGDGKEATITHKILSYWGKSMAEIQKIAENNMKSQFSTFCEPIEKLLGIEPTELKMWVVTYAEKYNRCYGARIICFKDLLNKLLEKNKINGDCYLIPSSIHELLIIFPQGNEKQLNQMIEEVNETCLEKREILSNKAYFFDRKKNEIRIVQ